MKTIQTTGVTMMSVCDVQSSRCIARSLSPITAVFEEAPRVQVNVCRPCFEEQIRSGNWTIQGVRVRSRADVTIHDENSQLRAMVEVKRNSFNGRKPPDLWAEKIHQQLLAYSALPRAPLLILIVFPRFMYSWHLDTQEEKAVYLTLDHRLESYFHSTPEGEHAAMENAVASWLHAISQDPQVAGTSLPFFEREGLIEIMQRGRIAREFWSN